MNIIELLINDMDTITSEINKYQFNILTNKSRLDDLILLDKNYFIIPTGKSVIPYLVKKNDETFYVPLDGGEKIHLFNIDVDGSSDNNYYITDSILVKVMEESVDYNEYGLPDKKLYKINTMEEIDKAIINFQYCDESCKPELVNNINLRCEDLDYKPRISSKNSFYNYSNKNNIIEVDELDDKFIRYSSLADSIEDYGWLADKHIDPIKSQLKLLLKTNKIGDSSEILSNQVNYSKCLRPELVSKCKEIDYLINAFNMSYLRRFIKTANNKLDNVVLTKIKLSNRFKELFVKTNNIGDELVFGVDENFLALIVVKVDTDDIILIPLIDEHGINKNNISALCLEDTNIKMRVRKLMVKSKGVKRDTLTEGITIINDDVKFSLTCESLEEFDNKINSYSNSMNRMIEEKNQEGILEGLACLLCIHTELKRFKLDNIKSLEESKVCDNLIDKSGRLFRETFSISQKIKPVNFAQYCRESTIIQTVLGEGRELEINITKHLRNIIL